MKTLTLPLALGAVLCLAVSAVAKNEILTSGGSKTLPQQSKLLTEINDRKIQEWLSAEGKRLLEAGQTVKMAELVKQLSRKSCSVKLASPSTKKLSAAETVAKYQAGTLVVAHLYQCDKCTRWHVDTAAGFMLNESGAFATCYHVVNKPSGETLLVLTGDGRLAAVKAVLAASQEVDLAILQLDGSGYTPLPLFATAPVGSVVRVLSHPDNHYYTLTEGIVSRYFTQKRSRKFPEVSMLAITADFAKGSSGAPVFNETGAVIGMVNSTVSTYYSVEDGHKENLQMVFKHCIPARSIFDLIQPR